MVNPFDSQSPHSWIWTFGMFFLVTIASSSDPCPPDSKLFPCWCTDFPLYWNRTTGVTEATTPLSTRTSGPPSIPVTTSTEESTSTTAAKRKRRHVKRQIAFSPFAWGAYYTAVTCNGTSTSHALEDAIGRGLERRWVDKVTIIDHRPTSEDVPVRLPAELFKNMRLKQIVIKNTLLAGDFISKGNPFEGQAHSLMWFTVNNCFLRGQLTYSAHGTVQTMGLNKLIKLQGVELSGNQLEYIASSAFRNPPPNMNKLILRNNKITVLEGWVLQRIPTLQFLDLSHNRLEAMRRSMLPSNATRLNHINISWNRLSSLPSDFFNNTPGLKIFNVSYNFLYSLPSVPWADAYRQLQVTDVTGNYLPCDCSLSWLPPLMSSTQGNGTSTPSPMPEKTILGTCSAFQYDSYPKYYRLADLTQSSLDC